MRNSKLIFVLVFGIFTILSSCQKSNNQTSKEPDANLNAKSTPVATLQRNQKNHCDFNVLVFKNEQDLEKTLQYLEGKSDEFLLDWEKKYDFVSMRQAFEEIIADEINFADNEELVHSDLIYKYPNSFVIEKTYDQCGFFDKNIHIDNMSKVVNPDGLIVVENSIYQYTKECVKVIKDGDINKIPNLLSATISDLSLGIEVYPTRSGTPSFSKVCQGDDGRLRILVYEEFVQNTPASYPQIRVTTYKVKVRTLQRRLWGLWYDNYKTYITLKGNHSGNTTYGWFANNTSDYLSWSGAYNVTSNDKMHTFEIFLPYYHMHQHNPGFTTDGAHPEIYQSWHKGTATRNGRTATCKTVYP